MHTVKKGETIYSIANLYKVSQEDLRKVNGIIGNDIKEGQILLIPGNIPTTTILKDIAQKTVVNRTTEDLRTVQKRFVQHVAMLIIYANDNGFEMTFGEATRSKDQVLLNFYGYSVVENANGLELTKRSPTSKTKESKHLDRLAIDFNIFKDGRLLFIEPENRIPDLKLVQMMGNYWCNLHPNNRWGGDFNRNKNVLDESFSDPYHYETS